VIGVLLTNHVLSGALIGALARRPASSFAAGVPASAGSWHSSGTLMSYSLAAFRPRIFFFVAVVSFW